jgi:hypothetical protein
MRAFTHKHPISAPSCCSYRISINTNYDFLSRSHWSEKTVFHNEANPYLPIAISLSRYHAPSQTGNNIPCIPLIFPMSSLLEPTRNSSRTYHTESSTAKAHTYCHMYAHAALKTPRNTERAAQPHDLMRKALACSLQGKQSCCATLVR